MGGNDPSCTESGGDVGESSRDAPQTARVAPKHSELLSNSSRPMTSQSGDKGVASDRRRLCTSSRGPGCTMSRADAVRPGRKLLKADDSLPRHWGLLGDKEGSGYEESGTRTAVSAQERLLTVGAGSERTKSGTLSNAPDRVQDAAADELSGRAWPCNDGKDPSCPEASTGTANSEHVPARTSNVESGCRRSGTNGETPTFTALHAKGPGPKQASDCKEAERSNRSMSSTSVRNSRRPAPNTAGMNPRRVTCRTDDSEPGSTGSSTGGVASKRQAPSHKKAKPAHARDLRNRRELGYKRSGDGGARPKRAQLKHSSRSPDQATALGSIGKPSLVAAKVGNNELGQL